MKVLTETEARRWLRERGLVPSGKRSVVFESGPVHEFKIELPLKALEIIGLTYRLLADVDDGAVTLTEGLFWRKE